MNIENENYYSVRQIVINKWLPWATSHITLTEYLNSPKGRELFKPIIKQTDKFQKYYVKGSTLLEIIKQSEEGKLIL